MISNPKFLYSSSADRGLDTLLHLWPHIRKEFPEATLKIFYGFSNWKKSIANNTVDEVSKRMYKDIMTNLDQPGVIYVGAMPQKELAQEWLDADIWLYTTRFSETYCIGALEAQLSKTVIVCSDLAGLQSTVADRGILIPGDAYTKEYQERALQETFAILQDSERRKTLTEKAYQWATQQTWANRAQEWLNIFGITPQNTSISHQKDVVKLQEIYDPTHYPAK